MIVYDAVEVMEAIVNSTGALIYVIDLETFEVLFANDQCREVFGNVVGKTCFKVLQKNQFEPCGFCPIRQFGDPLSLPYGTNYEWKNRNSINNRDYIFNDRIIEWTSGRKAKVQVGIDVTEQVRLEENLITEREKTLWSFEALLDAMIEGLIISDENKKCTHVNRVAPKLFGYTREEMIGQDTLSFISPESYELVRAMIQNSNQEPYDAIMLRKDGSKFPAILRGRDLELAGEKIRVSAVLDVSEIKEKEAQILKLAHYDSLTGLPNRLLFQERLEHALGLSRRNGRISALLFIDLDRFKTINDTKGHGIGDQVLVETARKIMSVTRNIDTVARLGGDEFVVLVETLEEDERNASAKVCIVAEKILQALREPYRIENYDFRLSASIGIAMFQGNGETLDNMMKYADSAMYHAKESGRDSYRFFDPVLQQKIEEKMQVTEELRHAIENGKLAVHYQKQVDAQGNVVGFEALMRMYDSNEKMVSPGTFIPVAEETGLIIPMGEWILAQAMQRLVEWKEESERNRWRISVNVSYIQFEKANFVPMIEAMLAEYGIDPQLLRLEITESLVIKNTSEALAKINRLKSIGLTLSIDDFGTGYSSLSYLKQLPIDELKIDRSFVRDIADDINDRVIVETIISIGRQFGLEVIAEGVENAEQYEWLKRMGCRFYQGYFFGRPVRVEKI